MLRSKSWKIVQEYCIILQVLRRSCKKRIFSLLGYEQHFTALKFHQHTHHRTRETPSHLCLKKNSTQNVVCDIPFYILHVNKTYKKAKAKNPGITTSIFIHLYSLKNQHFQKHHTPSLKNFERQEHRRVCPFSVGLHCRFSKHFPTQVGSLLVKCS